MVERREERRVRSGARPPEHRPRVVIDALAARYGGAAYATVQMASELADHPGVRGVVLIAREDSLVAGIARPRPGLRLVTLRGGPRLELLRRVAWEGLRLPSIMYEASPAVLLTWSGMLPRESRLPVICYLANPLVFVGDGYANRLRRWAMRRTAAEAAHVLVPSAEMGELVERHTGRRPEIVPLGVDSVAFAPASAPGDEILCVADPYRHKRHDLLLAAYAALPAPRPQLRLIGDPRVDEANAPELNRLVEAHRCDGRIVMQTGLSQDELVRAYHAARVFLLTSEYESFCLPLLEAQACGVPAVVRDMPALRESSAGSGELHLRRRSAGLGGGGDAPARGR